MMKKHVAALLLLCAALFALPVGAFADAETETAVAPSLWLRNANAATNGKFDQAVVGNTGTVAQIVIYQHEMDKIEGVTDDNNVVAVAADGKVAPSGQQITLPDLKNGMKNETNSYIGTGNGDYAATAAAGYRSHIQIIDYTGSDLSAVQEFIRGIQFAKPQNARIKLFATKQFTSSPVTYYNPLNDHFYRCYTETTAKAYSAWVTTANGKPLMGRNGYLASINYPIENSILSLHAPSGAADMIIGAYNDATNETEEDEWKWVNEGYSFLYDKYNEVVDANLYKGNWDEDQPNTGASEEIIKVPAGNMWHDFDGTSTLFTRAFVEFGGKSTATANGMKVDDPDNHYHKLKLITYIQPTAGMIGTYNASIATDYQNKTFAGYEIDYAFGLGADVTLPTPKYAGYTFDGWYESPEAAYKADTDTNITKYESYSSRDDDYTTYRYARWIKNVEGTIAWSDSVDGTENFDGHRPESVDLTLVEVETTKKEKTEKQTVSVNAGGNWKNTWQGMPVYNEHAELIMYTVDTTYDGTQSSTNLYAEEISELTAKLTHVPETISFGGSVFWDDDSNRDGQRENVVVTLYKDGAKTETVKTVTKPENANGTAEYRFDELYQYKNVNGTATEIVYSANIEDVTTGYTLSKEDHTADDETENDERKLKLSYTPQVVPVTVTINWPEDDKDYRPDNVTIEWTNGNGLPSGTVLPTSIAKPAEDQNSTTTESFNLYASANAAEKASYGIQLTVPTGYKIAENDTAAKTLELALGNTQANVSFTLVQDKSGEFEGQIVWDDEEDQDGKRPTSADTVKALLTIKDSKGKDLTSTALLSVMPGAETRDNWTYRFTGLPTHYADGSAASYTVSAANYQQNGKMLYSASVDETDKTTITMAYGVLMVNLTVGVEFSDAASQTQAPRPSTVTAVVKGSDNSSYSFMVPQTVEGVTTWSAAQEKPRYASKTPIDYTSATADLVLTDDGQNNAAKGYSVTGPKVTDAYREIAQGDPEADKLSGRTFTYTLTPKTFKLTFDASYDPTPDDTNNNDTVPGKGGNNQNFPTEGSYTYGADNKIPSPTVPGMTFVGWVIDDGDNDPTNDELLSVDPETGMTTIPVNTVGDLTLKAKYTDLPYQIRYILYSGTEPTPANPTSYTYYEAPVITDPSNPYGFTFEGWYADSGYTEKLGVRYGSTTDQWTFDPKIVATSGHLKLEKDANDKDIIVLELYARWTADFGPYTAEWDDEDDQDGTRKDTVFFLEMPDPTDPTKFVKVLNTGKGGEVPHSFTLHAKDNPETTDKQEDKVDGVKLPGVTVWHDAEGNPIPYTVNPDMSELADEFGNAYMVEHTDKDGEDQGPNYFRLKKNIYMKVFTVRVIWEDMGNMYGSRPHSLDVELVATGGEFDVPPQEGENSSGSGNVPPQPSLTIEPDTTATLSEGNSWMANWWAQKNPEPRVVPLKYDVNVLNPPEDYIGSATLTENEKVITFTHRRMLLPPTGDESNLALWGGLLALCVSGLGTLTVMRRKRRA